MKDQNLIQFFLICFLVSGLSAADQKVGEIVSVSRGLRLSRYEPQPDRTLFLNRGEEDDWKVGDEVLLTRNVLIWGNISTLVRETLPVSFGVARLVEVGKKTSRAKVVSQVSVTELSGITDPYLMVGDIAVLKRNL